MLKTGIYVDAENIRLSGGYGMRYDVLVDLANGGDSVLLRANSYVVEDKSRIREDQEYRQKLYNYFDILRNCGFKLIKKYVKRFVDENGEVTTKANADMDLAIDALLQSRNLDRIILVSGDGDFLRLVTALQNKGCRVEVIGFDNVNAELREGADLYLSGYLIPGLTPQSTGNGNGETWFRGVPTNYNTSRGFGFMRYYKLGPEGLAPETVFFHCSQSNDVDPQLFTNPTNIFEFRIVSSQQNKNRPEAQDIQLLSRDDQGK